MECAPALIAVAPVVNRAEPPETLALPICVAPSKNVTVPVGDPPKEVATLAVNVSACPYDDGFALEVIAVVVLAWFTVCARTAEVLAKK